MGSDPFATQRNLGVDAVAELNGAGLEGAAEIGRGGSGVVYRCVQPVLDRVVAVKVLTFELNGDRERFLREQQAMGRLTGHPNIVEVLEVGETESGRLYLVMPFHPQGSLEARIRRDGPLQLVELLRLGVKLAGALETAHRADILHRDVKPSNILLTDYGEPALTDFGIAHLAEGFRTATGAVTASPAFTAPEVLGGTPSTRASDVYSLGATLFCASTGHPAFERRSGEQVMAQFARISTQPVPDLRGYGIPADLAAVIETAMSHDSGQRPTAEALGQQLRHIQAAHGLTVDHMALRGESGEQPRPMATSAPIPAHDPNRGGTGLRTAAGNLPQELTSFVDRRSQVAEIKNLLSRSPLVTLTGIGGVGKSRLSLRAAHTLQRSYADGVWLVELAELRDPLLLVDVVTTTLGLRPVGRPALEALVEHLSGREVLLVVDNCEHMLDPVAELVEILLQSAPRLKILTTSREPLGIGGEAVVLVPPLSFAEPPVPGTNVNEAVTLFTERAVAVVPDFHLDESNRSTVADICARLDGLPLAIELAAARLRTLSADQISERLSDRFAVLTRGSRSAPTRQQTLGWCIDWSYDLCTATEQQLWGRMSVFAGTFDLATAEEICGTGLTEQGFLDAFSGLLDKSILIREQSGADLTFRMLETVQAYGAHKLAEFGERAQLDRRHRSWYDRLVSRAEADWVSSRQLQWITLLERELPNLRKSMEHSISEGDAGGLRTAAHLFSFWFSTGRINEGRRWCDRLLDAVSQAPAADRAGVLNIAIVFAGQVGDLITATERITELEDLAEQTADPSIEALLAYASGCTALNTGDLNLASVRLNDAVEAFRARENVLFELRALVVLGWALVLRGHMPSSIACLERTLTTADAHDETEIRSLALRPLALAVWRTGNSGRAIQLLKESLATSRRLVDPLVAVVALEIMAWISIENNQAERTAVLLGAAHGLGHFIGTSIVFPDMAVFHTDCVRRTQGTLGKRRFESAHRRGSGMTLESAVDFALGEQNRDVASADDEVPLTKRERQVMDLIAEGMTNKAIAARLTISQRTARGHVENILTKLGFNSRAQIAAWVAEHSGDTHS
ncbi:protein kinase domain-containing protein [Nocardia grenadensis]|uniref:protein kinase domain-containing protein n=1 Tax=Nocardia grenadensis TaxID=931537 RepID=UPI003D71C7A2